MGRKNFFLVGFLVCFFLAKPICSQTQTTVVKSSGGDFLKLGVGAKPMGLGGAYVSLANDLSALFWNPAGLTQLRQHSFLSYVGLLGPDLYQSFASAGYYAPWGVVGMGINYLLIDKIPYTPTRIKYQQEASWIKAEDLAVSLGYARAVWPGVFSLGGVVKGWQGKLGPDATTWVPMVDLGMLYQTRLGQWGIVLQNLGSDFKYWREAIRLPRQIKVGGTLFFLQKKLLFTADLEKVFTSRKLTVHSGVEYQVSENVESRVGISLGEPFFISTGLSAQKDTFRVDYAILFYENFINHRVSFSFDFGGELGRYQKLVKAQKNRLKNLARISHPDDPVVVDLIKQLNFKKDTDVFTKLTKIGAAITSLGIKISPAKKKKKYQTPSELVKTKQGDFYEYLGFYLACLRRAKIKFALYKTLEKEILLVNLNLPSYFRKAVSLDEKNYFLLEGEVYLPLKIEVLPQLPLTAWQKRGSEIKELEEGEIDFLPLPVKCKPKPPKERIKLSFNREEVENRTKKELRKLANLRREEVEKELKNLGKVPTYPNRNQQGVLLALEGQLEEARKVFKKLIEEDKTLLSAHLNLANVYLLEYKFAMAEVEYQIAKSLDPTNGLIGYNQTLSYLIQGKEKLALEKIKESANRMTEEEFSKTLGMKGKKMEEARIIKFLKGKLEKEVFYPGFSAEKKLGYLLCWVTSS